MDAGHDGRGLEHASGHGHQHTQQVGPVAGPTDDAAFRDLFGGALNRRSALKLLGAAAALTAVGPGHFRPVGQVAKADTLDVQPMATHIHTSFSEGDVETNYQQASMELQAQSAVAAGLSALWYTDHDWRMGFVGMPTALGLSSLSEPVSGGVWAWDVQRTGALASSNAAPVTSPVYPGDSVAGALRATANARPTGQGAVMFYADTTRLRQAQRATVAGLTMQLAVMANTSGPNGWAELRLVLSSRPAFGGRPGGQYRLTYRFSTSGGAGRTVTGTAAVIRRVVPAHQWSLQNFNIISDISACWPGLGALAQDTGMLDMWFGVVAKNGATSDFVFDHLRFNRSMGASGSLELQRSLMAAIQSEYPSVRLFQGLEVSMYVEHLSQLTPSPITSIPSYPPGRINAGVAPAGFNANVVSQAHAMGGVASLNHPFGVGDDYFLSATQMVAQRRKMAKKLLSVNTYNADLMEVAYQIRGYVNIQTHLDLAVTLAQSGQFVTWSGASDDHAGGYPIWVASPNRFIVNAWAAGNGFGNLTDAMRAGRVFPSQLASYGGALDLLVDGSAPMGSVSVRSAATRSLRVTATALPSGGSLEIRQFPMTWDNRIDPAPAILNQVVPASAVTGGTYELDLDTSRGSFAYALVRSASGEVVGLTNPVWLLLTTPPGGIPPARQVG